jgi:hypothetical protein
MDVVYICRPGDNEELRYSIRSVVKNLPHSRIWLIGGKPSWYTGDHIHVPQKGSKFKNARANMNAIVRSKEISDDFVLMNDDFFILKPIGRPEYYYAGTLQQKIEYFESEHPRSKYTQLLRKTMKVLNENGIEEPLDYALHVPFVMNKQKLAEVLPLSISWHISYGNIYKVSGERVRLKNGGSRDVKVYVKSGKFTGMSSNSISDIYLSTADSSFQHVLGLLAKRFPEPSKYEKVPTVKTSSILNSKKKMVVHSQRNATWEGVGKVYKGHNLVTEDQGRLWLSRAFIRISTEEEAVQEFGPKYASLKFDGFGKYNP